MCVETKSSKTREEEWGGSADFFRGANKQVRPTRHRKASRNRICGYFKAVGKSGAAGAILSAKLSP